MTLRVESHRQENEQAERELLESRILCFAYSDDDVTLL
jgi:hypothetical protein